mmetsp:Transcript_40364/g.84011  ORF Transcript_40364/g.84011 Transcript_40364/m.84011 type:complete len:253 (-) Transcript_40364:355-1113(-)
MSSSSDGGNETLFIIVGAAAGGGFAACVSLSILAIRRRRQPSSDRGSETAVPEEGAPATVYDGGPGGKNLKHPVSSEIVLKSDDDDNDVSTLGDPVLGGSGMMDMNGGEAQPDEQTASVENDYDYHKEYLRAQGIASLDSVDRISSDASLDIQYACGHERFEVKVPPGKLGMVIDTPNGGVPMVHAIKPESVLASQVKVGDRLLVVDGDDVTFMTAMQVSKLIALKSDQERIMVFVRGFDIEVGGGGDSIAT